MGCPLKIYDKNYSSQQGERNCARGISTQRRDGTYLYELRHQRQNKKGTKIKNVPSCKFETMSLEDTEKMAVSLMSFHGLRDWKFEWMQVRKRFNRVGQCSTHKKVISLQPRFALCNYPVIVKRTILHEIAHGLTPGNHHNKVWKQMAISIGDDGGRIYGKEVKKRMRKPKSPA